jgi:hypothetical protein
VQNVKNDIFKPSEDEDESENFQGRNQEIVNKSKHLKDKNSNKIIIQNKHGKSNLLQSLNVNKLNSINNEEESICVNYKEIIEEKFNIIRELKKNIEFEISKIVLCNLCKRKFANKAHYLRHVNLSELHKKNSIKFN